MNASDISQHVTALRQAAGFVRRAEIYTLVLRGVDRARFLNGMVTNDVERLEPGLGQLAVKASPRGRVEGVVRIRCAEDAFFIDVEEASAQAVADGLAKMIIMDDVTLSDGTDARTVIAVVGPEAEKVLTAAELAVPKAQYASSTTNGVTVIRDDGFGPAGYELHVPPAEADAWSSKLSAGGAVEVSSDALDIVRVEHGRPRDGVDIDADTIPMEARLDAALDFEKGCFVGQEVIARAHNLGGVKHILVGLNFDGETPPIGTRLTAEDDGKSTGEVTSAVWSPTLGRSIGLGYVRIAHQAPGTALELDAPEGQAETTKPEGRATVASLPFE